MSIVNNSELQKKVLIVDDEVSIRESLSIFLEDEDFEVFTAENGQLGIEQFKTIQPDIVILDLRMPGTSGMEVIPVLKEINPLIPILIISGNNDTRDADEAIRTGAWDYIAKPIRDLNVLLNKINMLLDKAFSEKKSE